jgi:uncharacterized membrane protein
MVDKPGYKTTEFYITLLPYILIAVKTLFGIDLNSDQITNGALGVVAVCSTISYIWSRTRLKQSAMSSEAVPTVTPVSLPTVPVS